MANLSELPPFACTATPEFASHLAAMGCSIAITTYQAGKLILISTDENHTIRQLPRDFKRAMGLAIAEGRMAIAADNEVVVLSNARDLAVGYPSKPGFYDDFFVPRAVYYTGSIDIHDLGWNRHGQLCAVNTLFSCLAYINDQFSFTPFWHPPFIPSMSSEDYCHLNGMAMVDDLPRYVTMFGQTGTPKGWRDNILDGGLIMDIRTNQIVMKGLSMPHSPRWINNELYCLESAKGELIRVDVNTGISEVVTRHNGFVRGLAHLGDYLVVGLSKIRTSTSGRKLPVSNGVLTCGLDLVHLPTRQIVGSMTYHTSVEEIYDVQLLPQSIRPGVLNHTGEVHRQGLHTPESVYWSADPTNKP